MVKIKIGYILLNLIFFLIFSLTRNLPPSQGGRYSGFGNTVDPPRNDTNDLLGSLTSVIDIYYILLS